MEMEHLHDCYKPAVTSYFEAMKLLKHYLYVNRKGKKL